MSSISKFITWSYPSTNIYFNRQIWYHLRGDEIIFPIAQEVKRAQAYYDQGRYQETIETYISILDFADFDTRVHIYFQLADIYLIMEKYQDSKKAYLAILDLDREEAGAWYGLAISLEALGADQGLLLSCYKNAVDFNPSYKEAYYNAGIIYSDMEDYPKAESLFLKVIELDPEDFICLNDLGSVYEKMQDYKMALSFVDKSIKINKSYYLSHFNKGVIMERLGDDKEALESYKKSSQLMAYEYSYLNMSALYIRRKNFKEALNILSQGISKNPHHILYYNRACVRARLKDFEGAENDYKEALALNEKVKVWAQTDEDLNFLKEVK